MSLVKSIPNEIRYDPNHAVANIFRILPKEYAVMPDVENPRPPRLHYWEKISSLQGTTIRFRGLFLLDVFDLHVLLALVMLAMNKNRAVNGSPTTDEGHFLRNSLGLDMPTAGLDEGDARQLVLDILAHTADTSLPIAAVTTCYKYELTKLVTGSRGIQSYKRVKDSLFRLMHTTLEVTNPDGSRYTSNMVSSMYEDKDKKTMSVAVNPVLTQSLRLDLGGRYIQLYFDTFSSLSQVGKLLYTYMSAKVWDHKPHEYMIETLVELMYPPLKGSAPVSRQAASKRVLSVLEALAELGRLGGWTVTEGRGYKGGQKWTLLMAEKP